MNDQKSELKIIESGLKVIADMWTLLILQILRGSPQRFSQIQKLAEINTRTLTLRLKKLEEIHFIERTTTIEDKQAVFYGLSPKGKKALVILDMIISFTKDNLSD